MPAARIPTESSLDIRFHQFRGHPVMIDRDLAALYGVSLAAFNQAVKRNLRRFPPDFVFQLTRQEYVNLKSQIVISRFATRPALAGT